MYTSDLIRMIYKRFCISFDLTFSSIQRNHRSLFTLVETFSVCVDLFNLILVCVISNTMCVRSAGVCLRIDCCICNSTIHMREKHVGFFLLFIVCHTQILDIDEMRCEAEHNS